MNKLLTLNSQAFQSYYTETLPEDPSTISWIGSIQVWLTFFIGAFSGRLLDAGLFVPTLFVGGILQVLGIFMMSLSTKWYQLFLSQGVLTGIGGGIFFCPSMGLIATYFSNRRALAVGLVSTGNSVGRRKLLTGRLKIRWLMFSRWHDIPCVGA